MFRKSAKPPAKPPKVWPYSDSPTTKEKSQDDIDREIESISASSRKWMSFDRMARPMLTGLLLICIVIAVVAWFASDSNEKAACEARGGRVAMVHGHVNISGAWVCIEPNR